MIYCFRVSAINKAGTGHHSEVSDSHPAVNPLHPPSQPCAPKAVDITATSVSLEWAPPKSDGGCGIIGYELEYHDEVCVADLPVILIRIYFFVFLNLLSKSCHLDLFKRYYLIM